MLANLDILRAIAVLAVFANHLIEALGLGFEPYTDILGRFGVLLFFVHTALVLNVSMERMRLYDAQGIRSFYIRRIFRIYPLSIVCVLTVLALHFTILPQTEVAGGPYQVGFGQVLSNLALTMNLTYSSLALGTLWSLPIEVQMYAALPIIFLMVRKRTAVASALVVVSVAAAIAQPSITSRLSVLAFAPCFMGGVLAYTLIEQRKVKLPSGLWFPFLITLCVAYTWLQGMMKNIHTPIIQWTFCVGLGAVIPLFRDSTSKLLNTSAQYVAKYSYGVYLFHILALQAAFSLALPAWSQAIIGVMLTAGVSVISYHWLEEPAIRLGVRVSSRAKQQETVMAGSVSL